MIVDMIVDIIVDIIVDVRHVEGIVVDVNHVGRCSRLAFRLILL